MTKASRTHAGAALEAFRKVKRRQLAAVAGERRTKRQAIDSMRRTYDKLSKEYHRHEGTTYQGWLDHGPKAEWDEVIAAAADESVWDRLVETYPKRKDKTDG